MKRAFLYVIILAALLWIPVESADVGKLRPVQLISLYRKGENYVLETDTGDKGVGVTVAAAFENLKQTTPAVIYLDTAQFLTVTPEALPAVDQMKNYVKNNVRVCQQEKPLDPQLTAQYLTVQKNLPKIAEINGDLTAILEQIGDRIFLVEKSEKNA